MQAETKKREPFFKKFSRDFSCPLEKNYVTVMGSEPKCVNSAVLLKGEEHHITIIDYDWVSLKKLVNIIWSDDPGHANHVLKCVDALKWSNIIWRDLKGFKTRGIQDVGVPINTAALLLQEWCHESRTARSALDSFDWPEFANEFRLANSRRIKLLMRQNLEGYMEREAKLKRLHLEKCGVPFGAEE